MSGDLSMPTDPGKQLPNTEPLYVGKGVRLRNRLQQHEMWNWMFEKEDLADSLDRLFVAVWYCPTRNECKSAEATLIQILKPRYNTVNEGEVGWTIRPPDLAAVNPLTIRPETRRDIGELCPIENRPGIYLWYLISQRVASQILCEILGWPSPELAAGVQGVASADMEI